MQTRRTCSLLLAAASPLISQVPAADPQRFIDSIRHVMQERLARVPNYVCLQTVDRVVVNEAAPGGWESKDGFRLEVAFIDNQELYSWPGANRFEEASLAEIIGTGLLASGEFAAHQHAVFREQATAIRFLGNETVNEKALLRYGYEVPEAVSQYWVETAGGGRLKSAYSGSFWVEPNSLEMTHFEIRLMDPPPASGVVSSHTRIEYEPFAIGEARIYLPAKAVMRVRFVGGEEARNVYEFSDCRVFGAESTLFFETRDDQEDTPVAIDNSTAIPAGVRLRIEWKTTIRSEAARAGDTIEGVLFASARNNKTNFAPKGTQVTGRIRQVELRTLPRLMSTLVMELTELRFGDRRAPVRATLRIVESIPNMTRVTPLDATRGIPARRGHLAKYFFTSEATSSPGAGAVVFYGERFVIWPGMRMVWRTIDNRSR